MGYRTTRANTWSWVWFLKNNIENRRNKRFVVSSLNHYLSKIIIQVKKIIAKETNWAALPISFAFLDNSCFQVKYGQQQLQWLN